MADKKEKSNKQSTPSSKDDSLSKGEILKAARLKKGLSLEVVQEETKIPLDALRAIEEGYTIRTLSKFYYDGFLKIYAKYLNIDVSRVIDKPMGQKIKQESVEEPDEFNIEEWLSKVFTRKRKQQLVVVCAMFLVLFVLFKIIVFFASHKKGQPVPEDKIKVTETTEIKPVETAEKKDIQKNLKKKDTKETLTSIAKNKSQEEKAPDPTIPSAVDVVKVSREDIVKNEPKSSTQKPQVTSDDAAKPKEVHNVTLTVRATKSGWLRVIVDGKVVLQSTLKMGSVKTWFADREIVISGRNISDLEFELNGKMIGKLGRKDSKVKEVTITEDGLQVTK